MTTNRKREIRTQRFNELLKNRFNGNQAEMARALDIAPGLVWRYINGKGIGEAMKDNIELKLQLSEHWMDGIEDGPKPLKKGDEDILKIMGVDPETIPMSEVLRVKEFLKLTKEQQTNALNFAQEEQKGRGKNTRTGPEGK